MTATSTQPTTTSSTTFTGLGGVQTVGGLAGSGLIGTSAKTGGRDALDLPVPPEVLQLVEALK